MEMADVAKFYFCEEVTYDEAAAAKFLTQETGALLQEVLTAVSKERSLEKSQAHRVLQQIAETHGLPMVKIAQPVRAALTGKTVSPPIDEVMDALGQEKVVQRLERALDYIQAGRGFVS